MITNPTTAEAVRPDTHQLLAQALWELAAYDTQMNNRRIGQRHPVHAPATLGVRAGVDGRFKPVHRVWLVEISQAGVSMLIEHELSTGMEMHLNLVSLIGRPCIVPTRIIYCSRLLRHAHRVGGLFLLEDAAVEPAMQFPA